MVAPGWVGAGSQGAQLCPGCMVLKPLPATPGPVTALEVPGCGLRVAAEGRGLCEVSTEPTPHSKQLGPAWVPAPSSRLAADR